MYLSGQTIRREVPIFPFSERQRFNGMTYGVGPAGYDVRLAQAIDLMPGAFCLASIFEWIQMPATVIGFVHDKSTLARLGLALQNTVIEPGWRGHLTIEISNHGPERIRLPLLSPIAQIIFGRVDDVCTAYTGKYQDQKGEPQPAIFEGCADDCCHPGHGHQK